MFSLLACAPAFTAPMGTMAPMRASAVSMPTVMMGTPKPLFQDFTHSNYEPVSKNFAANMGDCASIKEGYKPRIPATTRGTEGSSMFAEFVYSTSGTINRETGVSTN